MPAIINPTDEPDERDTLDTRVAKALDIVPARIAERDLDRTRNHVAETILLLDDRILALRAEITHARDRLFDTGIAADREWWRKANLAVLYKTRERQRLQFILSGISRRLKDDTKDKFIGAARDMLPEETYRAVWRAAQASGAERGDEKREPVDKPRGLVRKTIARDAS